MLDVSACGTHKDWYGRHNPNNINLLSGMIWFSHTQNFEVQVDHVILRDGPEMGPLINPDL